MIVRIMAGSIIALGLGLYSEGAGADQTFICEDGRLLQIELQDIERLKRNDPCVAAHYGLTVGTMPLPVQRPPRAALPGLKGAQAAQPPVREIGNVADVSSDYRRVRIINAQPGESGWYQHTR